MTWYASSTGLARSCAPARLAAVAALLVLAAGCGSSSPAPEATSAPPPVGAEPVKVSKVIDGDILLLADGRRVRVLGIDSCDARTVGGQKARIEAAKQLTNPGSQPVTLAREPGVDLDPTGMLLRYVQLNGADFGQRMIPYDHTGASAGPTRLSAGPAYLAVVRALDTRSSDGDPPVARECGGPVRKSSSDSSASDSSDSSDSSASESSDSSSSGSSDSSGSSGSSGGGSDAATTSSNRVSRSTDGG